jgi:hypothetical protein
MAFVQYVSLELKHCWHCERIFHLVEDQSNPLIYGCAKDCFVSANWRILAITGA